jgi:intein/homing endonuclease
MFSHEENRPLDVELAAKSLPPLGPADLCYGADTLVLSENGWKFHSEVKSGERIMVFDPRTNRIWLETPRQSFVQQHKGPMISFKHSMIDLLVTPNHPMVYKSSSRNLSDKSWKYSTAELLLNKRVMFPAIAEWTSEYEIETVEVPAFLRKNGSIGPRLLQAVRMDADAFLELAGYYLSEGGMDTKNHYLFTLAQSLKNDSSNIRKIRETLNKIPFHSHEYNDGLNLVRWNVSGKQFCQFIASEFGEGHLNKHIPPKYKALSKRQLSILFDSLFMGDGVHVGGHPRFYSTTSTQLALDVSEISLKLGYSPNIRVRKDDRVNRSPIYIVCLSRSRIRDVGKDRSFSTYYEGDVYGFLTSTGFYVTMRNGKVSFQGDSSRSQTRDDSA